MATILVVDDSPSSRKFLTHILRSQGHRLLEAGAGAEALALARAHRPDLVVTDILMPNMDGFEFVRRLQADPALSGTRVIFCTGGYPEHEGQELARACGVEHLIVKPVRAELVLETVEAALADRPPAPAAAAPEFDREHLQVLANQLARKITELEAVNGRLEAEIQDRRRAEEELKQATERLQVLYKRLLTVQEAERRHIARELHDEIGQALTAVRMNLLAHLRSGGSAAPDLGQSISLIEQTLHQVRDLFLDLRPSILDDLGLVAAVRWYLERQAERAGFAAEFEANDAEPVVPAEVATTCFRIVQEALTNVVRHAHARRVRVELRQVAAPGPGAGGRELHLLVRDDGVGFAVDEARRQAARGASLGVLGMEERVLGAGGRIDLRSVPGDGTEVRVWLPLAGVTPAGGQKGAGDEADSGGSGG